MNKSLHLFLFLFSFFQVSNAQFLWYENETNTYQIEFESTTAGSFFTDVTNPNNSGVNTNAIVSKFNRDEGLKSFLQFDLYRPVNDFSGYTVTIKAYIDLATELLTKNNSKLRVYFVNSKGGPQTYKQLNFTVGQAWESFTFDFNGTDIPEEIINANGYDQIKIGFATGSISEPAATYYIDTIKGTSEQQVEVAQQTAAWLSGSWGVTFPVYGGERLDSEVAGGYNLPAGAQQVVDELPATGHIITNLSYFAHSHYFTLRENANVNVVVDIHEALVPSAANEAIIYDVMQKFKDSGKKVILYISTNYLDRAIDDGADIEAAWINYYTNNFGGDEYLAYRDLIEGFILKIKDYADGYWLDTTAELDDDGHIEDFVQMIRDADPGCVISASPNGAYFTDENDEFIKVDSDGINDEDATDYKIVSFEGVNSYQDFTSGHVTPLGQGAPPNSWAYEEFTIPAMVENPWSIYKGNTVLKHAWFPMRDKWHVSSANLMFGTEDAYRFAKNLVDAKAGVTFATTIDDIGSGKGYMMAEELAIMKAINDRLLSNPVPDYAPYERPEGAYLVGESTLSTTAFTNTLQVKFYPNPVVNELTISRKTTDVNYITVVNVLGTIVIKKVWDNGTSSTQLNLSSLKSGLYFVNLFNGNNLSITQKIVVSK
ncbi:MAG: T9SS type A sorting domain-containing protein [Algibacter sp.]|uniref:T9SS type A sorting domain-containing protein n=1 Tax=Algibacter sp. TaxID=1872428 RepID=UPI003298B6F7